MAQPQHFYFDLWPRTDYIGAATGELTEAFDRTVREADQSIGSGEFKINRHSPQAGWCIARALVRVRLVPGGPFAYDDPRYIAAFFIETSDDVALSTDEEGGEVLTRGGPSLISWLKRTVIYPNANISGHASYWQFAKTLGTVQFPDMTSGEAFRKLLLNSMQRTGVLEGLTIDFTLTDDSSGTPWPDSDVTWKFPIGMNLLEVLSKVVSTKVYYRHSPDLLLQVFETHPGDDLSGSVTFSKGVDISEVSNKNIDAANFMSRALVRGDVDTNELKFVQVFDTGVEAETGRVEGFVEFKSTPTTGRLTRAGQQAIDRSKLQQDGPVTGGVISDFVPFVDYRPGDIVTVDNPGVYDAAEVRIAAIVLNETEGGEYDVIHEYQAVPFDPASGPDNFASSNDANPGPGGGPRGCGDCPQPGPFVPPPSTAVIDANLSIGSASWVGGVERQLHTSADLGVAPVALVVGQQYRLVADIVANLTPESYGADHVFALGVSIRVATDTPTKFESSGPDPDADWDGGGGTDTSLLNYDFGISWVVKNPVRDGGTAPNNSYAAGEHIEGQWIEYVGPNVDAEVVTALAGSALSGYYGFGVTARVRLETRNGDTTPIESEDQTVPFQGQTVGETATDPAVAGVYTTNYPYVAGSLRVWVSGVLVAATEVDPTAGTWQFPSGFDPGSGTITVSYQALSSTPTGATNGPWAPTSSTIPPSLLPSAGDDQWRQPARVATTGNVTISTALNVGDSVDGVTLVEGDRVLVRAQSTGSQNGIYIAGASPARALDFDEDSEVIGSIIYVIAGSTLGGKMYRVTNTTAPDVGTDTITFAEVSGGAGATALDDLTDVVITSPTLDDDLRYDGAFWVNDPRRWEAVTNGEDVFVWEGDDLVHEWRSP